MTSCVMQKPMNKVAEGHSMEKNLRERVMKTRADEGPVG